MPIKIVEHGRAGKPRSIASSEPKKNYVACHYQEAGPYIFVKNNWIATAYLDQNEKTIDIEVKLGLTGL